MLTEVQFPAVSRFQYEKATEQKALQEPYHYIDFTI